ncbi:MAG TPA: hypothetical protein VEK73_09015 [Xanthobacteraceae bacterium]|nr:hypothetical protein [Xanthobacteraceae bacterium]
MSGPKPSWNHADAQHYEAAHGLRWIRERGQPLMERLRNLSADDRSPTHAVIMREFFEDDVRVWDQFADHIAGRAVLDVGCGPIPFASFLVWAAPRIAIDPLIEAYDREARRVFDGQSAFDGLRCYAQKAEIFIEELAGAIDGAIICRNALDHLEFPAIVLSNLASYAASGCRLLLWSDIIHLNGGDSGHYNIAPNEASLERLVRNLGFEVTRIVPPWPNRPTISWGCLAIKVSSDAGRAGRERP